MEEGAEASPDAEAAVEAEAEPAGETPESEAESPPAVEPNDEEKSDAFQKRINKLTRSYRGEQRRSDTLAAENAELKRKLEEAPKPSEKLKTLEDFEYDQEKYLDYRAGKARDDAVAAAEAKARELAKDFQQPPPSYEKYDAAAKEFAKEHADFDEIVRSEDLQISPVMADVIRESDIGPQLAYHLGKNPDIALDLSRQSPLAAVQEMTKLELKLESELSKSPKTVSDAPPPPTSKVKGAQPGFDVKSDDPKSDKLSDAAWLKRREADLAKRYG